MSQEKDYDSLMHSDKNENVDLMLENQVNEMDIIKNKNLREDI